MVDSLRLERIKGESILCNVELNGLKPQDWLFENRNLIDEHLNGHGALLLRGIKVLSSMQFGKLLNAAFGENLLEYTYRSTPRTELKGFVYSATEYHSDQVILQHNENAYSDKWPMRIGFVSMLPATTGGETPIGCSRNIFASIPEEIKSEFSKKGICYIRNYGDVDLPWQEVFGTTNKAEVDKFCSQRNIKTIWKPDGKLQTAQVNPAIRKHPVNGEEIWFNQAHLFHYSALEKSVQDNLLASLSVDDLPRHVKFGDGTEIDISYLDLIRGIFQENLLTFSWEKHDILLLDNMLWTHGRAPFSGNRKTLVGMARTQM
tara:strand:- start:16 stop:969 length:954 start_codon:yes stop_codon:yes gene_type:complete